MFPWIKRAQKNSLGCSKILQSCSRREEKADDAFHNLGERISFCLRWFRNPLSIGALVPSGKHLAQTMADQVDPNAPGLVVELGPGIGVFTEALIARGIGEERLLLIECHRAFCESLRARFPRARIVMADAYDLSVLLHHIAGHPVAAVVSGLPMRNVPLARRHTLLSGILPLLERGTNAAFIQFSYALGPPIAKDDLSFSLQGSRRVWWNLFPAKVWTYRPLP